MHFDIVIGKGNKNKKSIKNLCLKNKNFSYHEQINYIGKLILKADLAIGSSGSTSWERCCLGLPSIISISANNQKNIAIQLSKKKCAINLGNTKKIKAIDYKLSIDNINKHDLERMSKNSFTLFSKVRSMFCAPELIVSIVGFQGIGVCSDLNYLDSYSTRRNEEISNNALLLF